LGDFRNTEILKLFLSFSILFPDCCTKSDDNSQSLNPQIYFVDSPNPHDMLRACQVEKILNKRVAPQILMECALCKNLFGITKDVQGLPSMRYSVLGLYFHNRDRNWKKIINIFITTRSQTCCLWMC